MTLLILDWIQFFLNGLAVGSLYALIAVGYSMVFGVLKFVNFAHGDLYMLGAYFVMALGLVLPYPLLVFFLSCLLCGLVSICLYFLVYKPVLSQHKNSVLISAVAVSLFLENGVQILFSPDVRTFPFHLPDGVFFLGERLIVRQMDLIITGSSFVVTGVTWLFTEKTKMGLAIRATASNAYASQIVGVSLHKVISSTFFLGSVLATIAGTFQGMATNQIVPLMGIAAGLKAFAAAVLGGVGSLWGAVIGGFVLGISESFFVGLGFSSWKESLAFVFLILILFFRPQGFLGEKEFVKV